MYLLNKLGGHRYYRNEDSNSKIYPYIDTLEKAKLTALIHYIARFLKSGKPIRDAKVQDTAGSKMRRIRRTQTIAKRFACHTNAISARFSENLLKLRYYMQRQKNEQRNVDKCISLENVKVISCQVLFDGQ